MAAFLQRARGERGFTLMELVVAMALMAIVVPAMVVLMSVGSRWGAEEREDSTLQTEVRAAMDVLASDLRQAYDGDSTTSPIEAIATTGFTFDSPDRGTPFHVRRISYRVSGNQLQRASWTSITTTGPPWTYPNTTAVWLKQFGSLVSATFTYYDANQNVTAIASSVRSMAVRIVVQTTGNEPRQFTYQSTIALRETQA